jgi:hypothetical protein
VRGEPDFLGRHGGWVLLVFGIALVTLAALLADKPAVASIFAFTGVASAIVGVLLARIEGPFELTATGLKARLRAARIVIEREDWTLEDKGDVLTELLAPDVDESSRLAEPGSTEARSLGRSWNESPSYRARQFEEAVRHRLEDDGWSVKETTLGRDFGADFVATRDGERIVVEAKARRRLGVADVLEFVSKAHALNGIDQFEPATFVLAVPRGVLTASARTELAGLNADVRLMEIDLASA